MEIDHVSVRPDVRLVVLIDVMSRFGKITHVTALCAAGLCLEFLHEFTKTERDVYAFTRTASGRLEAHLRHNVTIPRQFSIRAIKR